MRINTGWSEHPGSRRREEKSRTLRGRAWMVNPAGPSMFDGFTSAQVYSKAGSRGTEASSAGLLRSTSELLNIV